MVNYRLKAQLIEVVDNQLQANDPKCTKRTFERLKDLGYTNEESKEMIASVLVEEIYDVMKEQNPFNEKHYCKKLEKLPEYIENYEVDSDPREEIQKPVIHEQKVNRNEPCPCGSGKKYKKCCGK